MYYIYAHKNKLNNKYYVGISCQSKPKYRWGKNGNHYKMQPKFYRAIQKYGWDNFEHIILKSGLTDVRVASIFEQYYIKSFNSIKNGYNVAEGGVDAIGRKSEKSIYCLDRNGNIIRCYNSLTQAAILLKEKLKLKGEEKRIAQNISEVCHFRRKYAYNYGWCFCDNMCDYKPPKLNLNNKKVIQYTLTGEFVCEYSSISDAHRKTHINNIRKCCLHERNKAGNFIWKFKSEENV